MERFLERPKSKTSVFRCWLYSTVIGFVDFLLSFQGENDGCVPSVNSSNTTSQIHELEGQAHLLKFKIRKLGSII